MNQFKIRPMKADKYSYIYIQLCYEFLATDPGHTGTSSYFSCYTFISVYFDKITKRPRRSRWSRQSWRSRLARFALECDNFCISIASGQLSIG